MRSLCFLIFYTFFSSYSLGEIYKCEIDGVLSFSEQPCGKGYLKTEYKIRKDSAKYEIKSWEFHEDVREYDGAKYCYVQSKSDGEFVGKHRKYFEVEIVIMAGDFQLRTTDSFDHDFRKFSILIDKKEFLAEKRLNSKIISFGRKTESIIDQVKKHPDVAIKAKVVNWPYNDFYDVVEFKTDGFSAEYDKYLKCKV